MFHPHGLSKRELSLALIGSVLLIMLVVVGYFKASEQSVYASVLLAQEEQQANKVFFLRAHEERLKYLKKTTPEATYLKDYEGCTKKLKKLIDSEEFWAVNKTCTAEYSEGEKVEKK